jgi:hypothetical protein
VATIHAAARRIAWLRVVRAMHVADAMRVLAAVALVCALAAPARADTPNLVVFMDSNGMLDASGVRVIIPPYRGERLTWRAVVSCVRRHFAPFAIDVVDAKPTGTHIRVVVGGKASMMGRDDATTNGFGPHDPTRILRDATVHVFSELGTGERDIENLCSASAHEIGHSLGLDHVYLCGEIMSYSGTRCGKRRFIDQSAPCGEQAARECSSGRTTQNTFAHLVAWVGLRRTGLPVDPYVDPAPIDPYGPQPVDPYADGKCPPGDRSLACRWAMRKPHQ